MLPDDEEEEAPLQERKKKSGGSSRRRLEVQIPQSTPAPEATARTNVTFANPLTTDRPSGSTAQTPAAPVQLHSSDPATTSTPLEPSLFATYQTPDNSPGAAREALHQANLVMEQVKVMHEASQIAYNASTTLQTNVQVSKIPTELLNIALYLITQWVSLRLELREYSILHFPN
mgnify:FL=1